ncbi:MAG TPA: hypothetical protein VFI65_06170 [Streptosporangiaceae bacterium]|nr:hypothetical protein [Streptosporangiaceae bacterium]
MAADYEEIRRENIERYGWDTAVLELLGHLYSDRTHFIFELIQNAEDAGATELTFELFEDRLELRHDGRPFSPADVRGICGVTAGTKSEDLTQIGRFGIGFKSVYAYTNSPSIFSGEEHFIIQKYVRPFSAPPPAESGSGTLFVFPFDRAEVPAPTAYREISAKLASIGAHVLLFLRGIERISATGPSMPRVTLRRISTPQPGASRPVRLSTTRGDAGPGGRPPGTPREERRTDENWLVWSRELDEPGAAGLSVEVAFAVRPEIDGRAGGSGPSGARGCPPASRVSPRASRSRLVRWQPSPLSVFFPTEKETFLGFVIQGPYRTTPARDNVPEGDDWNRALVSQTASLLGEVLTELRDQGQLTVDGLLALPLEADRFPADSMFAPIFDAVRTLLIDGAFLPDGAGGYHQPVGLRLASDPGLSELLTPDQLGELFGASGFVDESVTEHDTPLLWRYLREEVGVAELTQEDLVAALTTQFLTAQDEDWLARLYAYLYRHPSLWQEEGPARTAPIIRLAGGTHVPPFDARGRPSAYLPGPVATDFPTVSRALAEHPQARRFLDALDYAEPDLLAEIIDRVLPRYAELDVADLDAVRHDADLELVARALTEVPPSGQERLAAQLAQTTFLIGENAATTERALLRPADLYQRTKALEAYLAGNPDAWFAADTYGPWRAQLAAMGVRETVRLSARAGDELGFVVIAEEFARHERGIAGFDPDATLDGLDYALAHPSHPRCEYVWNVLLVPHRHLVAGVVERSVRLHYADADRERALSVIGTLASQAPWLPAPDGSFRRPAELSLDDLPDSYQRDDGLAQALGMAQPAVAQASRELGFPPDFLVRLSKHPDLVAEIGVELDRRDSPPA